MRLTIVSEAFPWLEVGAIRPPCVFAVGGSLGSGHSVAGCDDAANCGL